MVHGKPRVDAIELPESSDNPTPATRNVVDIESLPEKPMYLKLLSSGFSFFVAGVNDGSLGALIPYFMLAYEIDSGTVTTIYGTTFSGWLSAALTNNYLHKHLSLGAMLFLGAVLQVIAHALRFWLPPFGLFAVTFWIVSLGQAFQDSHANSFVASVKAAHRWLGFIHAMYAAGCLIGPFAATAIASAQSPSRWNLFYTVPLGLGAINMMLVVIAFRDCFSIRWRFSSRQDSHTAAETGLENQGALKQIAATLQLRSVWILSVFFFFYLGASITAGGWLVEYLVKIRNGNLSEMGYVSVGFYGGSFLGRLLLAEPTHRFGERRMLLVYVCLCVVFQLLFWLVPNLIAASVAVSFLGFFSGPLFAAAVSVGSQLFPTSIRSSALAFMFVLGQIGGSIFPAVTGVIASKVSVEVLQPMLVGLLIATGVSWVLVPRKGGGSAEAEA